MKPSSVTHTLKVKCPTWDHVESFYARKVKDGNVLSARVPFQPAQGEVITLALELPDELVIAIDGEVVDIEPAPDGKKAAVRLRLVGLTPGVRGRLEALVADARQQRSSSGIPVVRPAASAPPAVDDDEPPVPTPVDAPIDELIEPLVLPAVDAVPEREREVFAALTTRMHHMRAGAAHEVLGVKWDAGVAEIRRAYFELTHALHPDVFARHRSSAIQLLASEIFIHVNRAYDRMRDAAVASGSAIVAGPALLPHRGFMAGFDDIGGPTIETARPTIETAAPFSADELFDDVPREATPRPEVVASGSGPSGASAEPAAPPPLAPAEAVARAREQLARRAFAEARELLAGALRAEPRNRAARALYHLASAEILLADGKAVDATTQLEVAMAHDPTSPEVNAALARVRREPGRAKTGLFRKLFK